MSSETQVSECQFHQRLKRAKFCKNKYKSCVLGLKFLGVKILYEKLSHKRLMKLTPFDDSECIEKEYYINNTYIPIPILS